MAQDEQKEFDHENRREELEAKFAADPETARKQISILPYYHSIENAITRPNQGTWVTRYFRTKWRPALGSDVADLVEALRFCADKKTGETIASMQTIAEVAGLSRRTVERLLSSTPPKGRSEKWVEQWRLLHEFFIVGKKKRYRQKTVGGRSQVHQTTNRLTVAMDEPVHPDDQNKLYAEAATRIASDEAKELKSKDFSYDRPADGHRDHEVLRGDSDSDAIVDNSAFDRPAGGHIAPSSGRSGSYSYRINVPNVKRSSTRKSGLSADPRVQAMTSADRQRSQDLAQEIGRQLHLMAGNRDLPDTDHKSLGFHRRIAFLMPQNLVYEALTATRDAVEEKRSGRKRLGDVASYFAGAVQRIEARESLALGIRWKKPVQTT